MTELLVNTDIFSNEDNDNASNVQDALAVLNSAISAPAAGGVQIKAKSTLLRGKIGDAVKALVGQRIDVSKVPVFKPGGDYVFPDRDYEPQVIPENSYLSAAYSSGRYTYLEFAALEMGTAQG